MNELSILLGKTTRYELAFSAFEVVYAPPKAGISPPEWQLNFWRYFEFWGLAAHKHLYRLDRETCYQIEENLTYIFRLRSQISNDYVI